MIQREKKIHEHHKNFEINAHCPYCSSENVYGISRVVGYFSVIDNWNNSKKAEFVNRQKGTYWNEDLNEINDKK